MEIATQPNDLAALRIQLDWGADEALAAAPLNRFRPAKPAAATPRAMPEPARALQPARDTAMTLDALHSALDQFQACALRATASNTVRPAGTASARFVIIGEAPGPDDDRSGQAFTGPQGRMLDQVLGSAGLHRNLFLMTMLVPWRPPGGRPLNEPELRQCLPFTVRLLELLQPERMILLGQWPARLLMGSGGTVRQLRGQWRNATLPYRTTPLPSLVLPPIEQWWRNSTSKRELWADILLLSETILNN